VPTAIVVTVAALGGLFVGGYATTLITRFADGEDTFGPPGRCARCRRPLAAREMVPVVSWLLRRGACGTCDKPFGVHHPIVELLTAAVFAVLALRIGPHPELAAYLYLAAVGVVLSGTDMAVKRLPDMFTKPSYLMVGGLLAIAVPYTTDGAVRFGYALLGMAVLWGLYFVLWFVNPRGMAWGDVKLSGALGLGLGWMGTDALILGAFAGFLFGALYGFTLMALGRARMKTQLPFGPFMIIGALVGILIGTEISVV